MIQDKVNLIKTVFEKNQYEQTIDTSFSQLVAPPSSLPLEIVPTVDEFFQNYDTLFFQIPKTGNNSHETLIISSTEYIGYSPINEEITALTEEITSLREQLLDARQQIQDLVDSQTTNG